MQAITVHEPAEHWYMWYTATCSTFNFLRVVSHTFFIAFTAIDSYAAYSIRKTCYLKNKIIHNNVPFISWKVWINILHFVGPTICT